MDRPTSARWSALGRYERQLVASEPRTSVLVSAPTQSGKTTSLVIPAILEWDGPILATSIKADLVNDTHTARTQHGDVKVFDPTASTGLPTGVWSPIAGSGDWSAARRTAAGILLIREKDAFGRRSMIAAGSRPPPACSPHSSWPPRTATVRSARFCAGLPALKPPEPSRRSPRSSPTAVRPVPTSRWTSCSDCKTATAAIARRSSPRWRPHWIRGLSRASHTPPQERMTSAPTGCSTGPTPCT
jgi:Type IV secretory system Conjugative DNA transfer